MKVTVSDWDRYIGLMNRINAQAGTEMAQFLLRNIGAERSEVVDFAYALATKYGEASSALACEMYDALAEAQGASVPPAEPAATATYDETAKAVSGTMKNRRNSVPDTVSRLVKQAGADTMLQNAKRDRAEFAWVPRGDTCAFCIMLASNGWQHQSRNAMKNGHASHIHANCDCEYVVRFDGKSSVEGYDPDEYLAMYENAEGATWKEKLNSMRREQYAEDRDRINAQKRAAYRERQRKASESGNDRKVDLSAIASEQYRMKFREITGAGTVDDAICHQARGILEHRSGTGLEDLVLLDAETGSVIHKLDTSTAECAVQYDDATLKAIERAHERGRKIIALHNHPDNLPPSLDDGVSMLTHGYDYGIVVAHDGSVYSFTPPETLFTEQECRTIHNFISYQIQTGGQIEEVWYNMLEEYGMHIERR